MPFLVRTVIMLTFILLTSGVACAGGDLDTSSSLEITLAPDPQVAAGEAVVASATDNDAPVLDVNDLPCTVTSSTVMVTGSVENAACLTVNNIDVSIGEDSRFAHRVALVLGDNTILVKATDVHGNAAEWTGLVTRSTPVHKLSLTLGNASADYDGRPYPMGTAPITVEGRTLVPFRPIGEILGAKFEWDGVEKAVTFRRGSRTVVLRVGERTAVINGVDVPLDTAPVIRDGRTLVPLRLVTEVLGAASEWQPETRQVHVRFRFG